MQRLLDRQDIQRISSLSMSQIYRLESAGCFPRRVRIGMRRVAWIEAEVRDWIAERMAIRNAFSASQPRGHPG
jgi:prophage regulatory protein